MQVGHRRVQPRQRLLQRRDRRDVDRSVDHTETIEVDLAEHAGDRVGDRLGRPGQIGRRAPVLRNHRDEPRRLGPWSVEVVVGTAQHAGGDPEALPRSFEVAGLEQLQGVPGFVGAVGEVGASRCSRNAESEQRQQPGGQDPADDRPQVHATATRSALHGQQGEQHHGHDGHRGAEPEPPDVAEPRQDLHADAQHHGEDDRALRAPPVLRPRRGGDAEMHKATAATSSTTSTTVDPVGEGPASTTPKPAAVAIPAIHMSLTRTARLCPSSTAGEATGRRHRQRRGRHQVCR